MKASKWLARWNYVFYILKNNWKNLREMGDISASIQCFRTPRTTEILKQSLEWCFTGTVWMLPDWQLRDKWAPTSAAIADRHYDPLHQWHLLTHRHTHTPHSWLQYHYNAQTQHIHWLFWMIAVSWNALLSHFLCFKRFFFQFSCFKTTEKYQRVTILR